VKLDRRKTNQASSKPVGGRAEGAVLALDRELSDSVQMAL